MPFFSLNDCGGTGRVIMRVLLLDLETLLTTTSENFEIIIYGCGDGYCMENYENSRTCFGDCE